jgi:hypothetical protein
VSLRHVAILLGLIILGCGVSVLVWPVKVPALLKRFPRSTIAAWLLTAVDLAWSAVLLCRSTFLIKYDWAPRVMIAALPVVFIALAFFLDELLAVRSLGGLLLLAAAPVLDVARLHQSPWRIVIPLIVYAWIIAGMVLMLSPYKLRQTVEFMTRTSSRTRGTGLILSCLGLFVTGLAVLAY